MEKLKAKEPDLKESGFFVYLCWLVLACVGLCWLCGPAVM